MANTSTPHRADPVLQVRGLRKTYGQQLVLDDVHVTVAAGESLVIVGASGSGKSTLLNCIAGLDDWQAGDVLINGQSLSTLDEAARALLRRQAVGFVFQAFHVLPHLNVAQNVAVPLLLLGHRPLSPARHWEDDDRVRDLLAAVGLDGLAARMPAELSGGQLQRVAIARALIHHPALLLADEPTGNLDAQNAERVMSLLRRQSERQGAALVLVTHAEQSTTDRDRVLKLGA